MSHKEALGFIRLSLGIAFPCDKKDDPPDAYEKAEVRTKKRAKQKQRQREKRRLTRNQKRLSTTTTIENDDIENNQEYPNHPPDPSQTASGTTKKLPTKIYSAFSSPTAECDVSSGSNVYL